MASRLWESVKSIAAFAAALVLGVLVTAAAFFFKILPDRERQKRMLRPNASHEAKVCGSRGAGAQMDTVD